MEEFTMMVKAAIAAAGGCVVYWLGGLDQLLTALVALVVLDYLSGLLAAWVNRALSSRIGFQGIAKKIMTLAVVALAYTVQDVAGVPLREITIMFFIVNEALSILENAAEIGLPIPQKLRAVLQQLRGKDDSKDGTANKGTDSGGN